jgi:hypothetical protein
LSPSTRISKAQNCTSSTIQGYRSVAALGDQADAGPVAFQPKAIPVVFHFVPIRVVRNSGEFGGDAELKGHAAKMVRRLTWPKVNKEAIGRKRNLRKKRSRQSQLPRVKRARRRGGSRRRGRAKRNSTSGSLRRPVFSCRYLLGSKSARCFSPGSNTPCRVKRPPKSMRPFMETSVGAQGRHRGIYRNVLRCGRSRGARGQAKASSWNRYCGFYLLAKAAV